MTILVLSALFITASNAQKIAIVDINTILDNMSDFKKAQEELDKLAAGWQQEIALEHDKIKSLYNKYQAEQVLLSPEMKTQREEEIMRKEKEVMDMNKEKFGPEGALFQRRSELVEPIQDKVYEAIESFANDRGYDIILDKNSASGIIFANDRYDKTSEIMAKLGIK